MANGRSSRVPSLGRNGGGWVLLQFLTLGAALAGAWRGSGDAEGQLLTILVALGCTLIGLGVVVLILGFRNLGHSVSMMPRPVEGGTLVVDGIYTYIRHPFYLGLMLVMVGFSVAMDSVIGLLLDVLLGLVLDLKSRREEVWLRDRYSGWDQYAARTKRFVPYVY